MLSCKLYVIAPITVNEIFVLWLFEGKQILKSSIRHTKTNFDSQQNIAPE